MDKFKKGSEYSISDILRIYLQAAVDNSKYMLLDQWDYSSDTIRKGLWQKDDGSVISKEEWKIVKELMDIYGKTGNIRNGQDRKQGIWSLQTMIRESRQHLDFVGYDELTKTLGIGVNRERVFREHIAKKFGGVQLGKLEFKDGVSSQEALVVMPALIYHLEYSTIPGLDGSPFKHLGWDLVAKSMTTDYHRAHTYAKGKLQEAADAFEQILIEQKLTAKEKKELEDGMFYATNMTNAMYTMFGNFERKEIDPGFLGWSHNETMVKFLEKWSKEYKKLSENGKKVATFTFLEGVKRGDAPDVQFPHQIPPLSLRKTGKTLLEPKIMAKYFKLYTEALQNSDFTRADNLVANSRHDTLTSFITRICD